MKVVGNATFNEKDIRDTLSLATATLPAVYKFPNGFQLRKMEVKPVTHYFLCHGTSFVGVASTQPDRLPFLQPTVKGIRVFQTGLLKDYRGFGFLWRVLDYLVTKERVFASPTMTTKGKQMWMKRIAMDKKHIYLGTNPDGLEVDDPKEDGLTIKMFVPIHKNNIGAMQKVIWDGNLKTRLLMVKRSDVLIKRYEV
jgi:hypothetical protein